MFTVVGDILLFLTNSPKRQAAYSAHSNNAEMLKKKAMSHKVVPAFRERLGLL